MLVKMRRDATADEIATVERKLHDLGFKTGKLEGVEITLVGVYGDISKLPQGEIAELAGVEQLIPISRAYKRVAQKGDAGPSASTRRSTIGNVVCGGDDLVFISGPVLGRERAADHGRGPHGEGGRLPRAARRRRQVPLEPLQRLGRARRVGQRRRCAAGSS